MQWSIFIHLDMLEANHGDMTTRKNSLTINGGHVKLGYEFFEVRVVRQHILPSFVDAIKHPIREIESPILQTKHQFWGRANEIKENESGC